AALAEQLSGLTAQSAPALPPIPAANQPPPRPQPARSSPEPLPVPPIIAAEKPVIQGAVVARPEVHESLPGADVAHRQGDAAALWFPRVGMGNLVLITGFLAHALSFVFLDRGLPGGQAIEFLLIIMLLLAFPGAAGACQFLASGSLKNFRGKAKVITAIVFGFLLGLLCASGVILLGLSMGDSSAPGAVLLLHLLVTIPTSVVNFLAAICGILVLKNAVVREEFGRPANPGQETRPIFSKNVVIGLPCGLAGWFFLILLLLLATWRP